MDKWVKGQRPEGDMSGVWAMDGLLEKMNDQQIGQVWELYNAIRERGRKSVDDEDLVTQAERDMERSDEEKKG